MLAPIHSRSIVILDFGGQYAHLIARRVREAGAFSEIRPPDTSAVELQDAAGIILSGGPQSVYDAGSPQADPKILELGIPVLGICYGHHWIAHTLGGEVTGGKTKEYGRTPITRTAETKLFDGLPDKFVVWMSHGDEVTRLPRGFVTAASSSDCVNAAMADDARKFFSIQFHAEVVHTEHGSEILKRFVALTDHAEWSIKSYAQRIGEEVKKEVGDKRVFMMVSGGVDSSVAFTVLNEVLGSHRVQGLLVETGMMRKNESRAIMNAFDLFGIENLEVVDASEEFFANLKGVYEPEAKRKIIGETFLAVQRRVSEEMHLKMEDGWMFGQGTIYPDTIETGGTKHSDTIKTHHNRVEAVQRMIEAGQVIEPLKDLYKDEVRQLGEEIGLSHDLVWRHPFPGPGLGVRILCAEEELTPLRSSGSSEGQEIENGELRIDGVVSAVLPVQSVGVQGDGRTYRHAVALYSSTPSRIEPKFMELATTIPNTHKEFNRVSQCTSHAVPTEFVFTPGYITRERADLLREADDVVYDEMHRANLYDLIWQFPVVLLPFGTKTGGQSIVLRPIESQEAMTANAVVLPEEVVRRMTEKILKLPGIDCVFIDLTNKPPATIEWE